MSSRLFPKVSLIIIFFIVTIFATNIRSVGESSLYQNLFSFDTLLLGSSMGQRNVTEWPSTPWTRVPERKHIHFFYQFASSNGWYNEMCDYYRCSGWTRLIYVRVLYQRIMLDQPCNLSTLAIFWYVPINTPTLVLHILFCTAKYTSAEKNNERPWLYNNCNIIVSKEINRRIDN